MRQFIEKITHHQSFAQCLSQGSSELLMSLSNFPTCKSRQISDNTTFAPNLSSIIAFLGGEGEHDNHDIATLGLVGERILLICNDVKKAFLALNPETSDQDLLLYRTTFIIEDDGIRITFTPLPCIASKTPITSGLLSADLHPTLHSLLLQAGEITDYVQELYQGLDGLLKVAIELPQLSTLQPEITLNQVIAYDLQSFWQCGKENLQQSGNDIDGGNTQLTIEHETTASSSSSSSLQDSYVHVDTGFESMLLDDDDYSDGDGDGDDLDLVNGIDQQYEHVVNQSAKAELQGNQRPVYQYPVLLELIHRIIDHLYQAIPHIQDLREMDDASHSTVINEHLFDQPGFISYPNISDHQPNDQLINHSLQYLHCIHKYILPRLINPLLTCYQIPSLIYNITLQRLDDIEQQIIQSIISDPSYPVVNPNYTDLLLNYQQTAMPEPTVAVRRFEPIESRMIMSDYFNQSSRKNTPCGHGGGMAAGCGGSLHEWLESIMMVYCYSIHIGPHIALINTIKTVYIKCIHALMPSCYKKETSLNACEKGSNNPVEPPIQLLFTRLLTTIATTLPAPYSLLPLFDTCQGPDLGSIMQVIYHQLSPNEPVPTFHKTHNTPNFVKIAQQFFGHIFRNQDCIALLDPLLVETDDDTDTDDVDNNYGNGHDDNGDETSQYTMISNVNINENDHSTAFSLSNSDNDGIMVPSISFTMLKHVSNRSDDGDGLPIMTTACMNRLFVIALLRLLSSSTQTHSGAAVHRLALYDTMLCELKDIQYHPLQHVNESKLQQLKPLLLIALFVFLSCETLPVDLHQTLDTLNGLARFIEVDITPTGTHANTPHMSSSSSGAHVQSQASITNTNNNTTTTTHPLTSSNASHTSTNSQSSGFGNTDLTDGETYDELARRLQQVEAEHSAMKRQWNLVFSSRTPTEEKTDGDNDDDNEKGDDNIPDIATLLLQNGLFASDSSFMESVKAFIQSEADKQASHPPLLIDPTTTTDGSCCDRELQLQQKNETINALKTEVERLQQLVTTTSSDPDAGDSHGDHDASGDNHDDDHDLYKSITELPVSDTVTPMISDSQEHDQHESNDSHDRPSRSKSSTVSITNKPIVQLQFSQKQQASVHVLWSQVRTIIDEMARRLVQSSPSPSRRAAEPRDNHRHTICFQSFIDFQPSTHDQSNYVILFKRDLTPSKTTWSTITLHAPFQYTQNALGQFDPDSNIPLRAIGESTTTERFLGIKNILDTLAKKHNDVPDIMVCRICPADIQLNLHTMQTHNMSLAKPPSARVFHVLDQSKIIYDMNPNVQLYPILVYYTDSKTLLTVTQPQLS